MPNKIYPAFKYACTPVGKFKGCGQSLNRSYMLHYYTPTCWIRTYYCFNSVYALISEMHLIMRKYGILTWQPNYFEQKWSPCLSLTSQLSRFAYLLPEHVILERGCVKYFFKQADTLSRKKMVQKTVVVQLHCIVEPHSASRLPILQGLSRLCVH